MTHKIFIGCSGFSGVGWNGFFYPDELPAREQLSFYAQHFNSVEINSTFYRKPRLQTIENWRNSTNAGFRFFIKIPKTITHIRKLEHTAEDTADFCEYIAVGLKDKLAGFLFQLPPSFHYSEVNLEKVLRTVLPGYRNVIEFRHASWWRDDVFKILKESNIVFAGVSYPKGLSDELILNHKKSAYYRLHGVPVLFKSEYPAPEMELLAQKIKTSEREIYLFFNNTWGTAALKNALYLKKILNV